MNLSILIRFTVNNHVYKKNIDFIGIKDFTFDGEFISFVEYGRLSETVIEMKDVINFTINPIEMM